MNSRRLIQGPKPDWPMVSTDLASLKGHVRFGSKADMCSAKGHVRFTPNSDRESRHPQTVMSALHPKADMCGATRDVRFGPIADIPRNIIYAATRPFTAFARDP